MKDRILIHYLPSFLLINSHRVCIIFEAGTTPQWREDPRSGMNHVKGSHTEGLSKHSGIATKEKVIDILSSTHIRPVYPSNGHVHHLLIHYACRTQSRVQGGGEGGSVEDVPIDPINYRVNHALKL